MSKPKRTIKIIGERDIELNLSNPAHHERIASIGKALSSPIRLQILALLKDCAMSVQVIAHMCLQQLSILDALKMHSLSLPKSSPATMALCVFVSVACRHLLYLQLTLNSVQWIILYQSKCLSGTIFNVKLSQRVDSPTKMVQLTCTTAPPLSILRTEPKHSSFGFDRVMLNIVFKILSIQCGIFPSFPSV